MHGSFEPVRSRNESYPAWLGGEGQAVGCESPWREGLVNLKLKRDLQQMAVASSGFSAFL